MARIDRIPWETPHRRLSPLTPVARGLIFVAFGAAAAQDDLFRRDIGVIGWSVLALLTAGAVYGGASWWLTKFWLTPYELRVDTGVINRVSRRIRIDRIQEIDLVAPFVARLFGLAEVRLDVAGQQESDASLAFLSRRDAQEVKEMLLLRRELARAEPGDGGGEVEAEGGPETELARVTPGRQAAVAASQASTWALLASAGLLGSATVAGRPLLSALMVPVVGALALVVTRHFLENYGFRLSEDRLGLHVRRGFFDLSHQTISTHRLQGVVVTEPWLWRLAGWARLDVATAGSLGVGKAGPDASTVLLVGDADLVYRLAERLAGGVALDDLAFRPPPARAVLAAPVRWRGMAYAEHPMLVACRHGVLRRRTHLVPHARVQSLRLRQGPWQRVLGLGTLFVDSPVGPVRVAARHRSVLEVRALLDREIAEARASRSLHAHPR